MSDDKVSETPTYSIKNVEVFSAGTWNKDEYKIDDLAAMVSAFNNLKTGVRPYLKLGHDNKQNLAKSSGLPAIGWVENLYIKGEKLFADLNYIPKKIYELIKKRAYRKVSCEIYWDLDVNGVKYPRVLGAIALLGAESPGVMNLSDILGNYSLLQNNSCRVFNNEDKTDSVKTYEADLEISLEDKTMSDENKKVDELEAEIAEQKKNYEAIEAAKSNLEKELEKDRAELKKYQQEAEAARQEAKAAKTAQFVSELEGKKLISTAMKDLVSEILSDKKEYTVKEKVISKEELLTEILTLSQEVAKVNFSESSRADFVKKEDKEKDLQDKIEKYALDNKCSMAQAYKAVMKEAKPEDKLEE
jgi:hypothetical protein